MPTAYETYLSAKNGESAYQRYRRLKMAANQSTGGVAPTNPSPPSISGQPTGSLPTRLMRPVVQGVKGLVGLAGKWGEATDEDIQETVTGPMKRFEERAGPGIPRGISEAARTAIGGGQFFTTGMARFADQMANPERQGQTTGEAVKGLATGLIEGGKAILPQAGELYRHTLQNVAGTENPPDRLNAPANLADRAAGLMMSPEEIEAAKEGVREDPFAPFGTGLVLAGGLKAGAGLARGLKARTVVPEKAPIEQGFERRAAVEPQEVKPPFETSQEPAFEGPISLSQAMSNAEKLTAVRKERARRVTTPRQLPTTTENVSPLPKSEPQAPKADGVVPEWGTRNQYYENSPYRTQLDDMKRTGQYDEGILKQAERWEMGQVLGDKPAYLNDGHFLPESEVRSFAKENGLVIGKDRIGTLVVAKDNPALQRVINAQNQRELGLALGYQDVAVSPQGAKPPVEPPKPPVEKLAEPPEPQKGVSSLSIRTEADAIAKKLTDDFGSLPEYKTMDMREQANRAKGLIDTDVEQAKRIAMGLEAAPEGLRDASVYEAVKLDALKNGDVDLLRKLAVESTVPSKLSAYGQEIKASDSKLMDDPVRVMQDVAKTRQEYAKRTGQRYTSEEIERLKTKLADAEKKLSERVKTAVGKAYGAKNRIVSTQAYLAARESIRASLATAHSGIPPHLLADVTKIGAYHLEAGTRLFADWSAKMIADLGEQVKPHLDDIWKSVGNDRRLQIALKAQKTRLEREAGSYRGKLENLDLTKPDKRTLVLDPEARRLKVLRDVAKRDWEAALNSYGSVTKEEAGNIVKLSKEMTDKLGELEKGGNRLEYGAARVAYENYVNYLKGEQTPLRTLAKAGIDKFKTTAQTNKAKAVYDLGTDALKVIVNNSVSMVATLDNSFLGRQGLKTLQVHPTVWAKGAVNSFVDIWKTLGGKDAHSALMADVYSRPNYLNGSYEKAGILAKVEEQYPSSLPERIPGVGRVFKASENAFTGSAIRMRTGLYDLLAKRAAENGIDMTDAAQIKPIGKLINSLTARGQWGVKGEPAVVRLVMWAPKMLKGHIDVLTAHGAGIGLESAFARKQAAINLLKIVTETATLMTIANALKPGSAETDPRSSDFGKIKIGNTRFDITGGAASIVTLAARISTGERKSTSTGEMIPYGTKYGQASELDALVDFLANKTNPPAHVVVDWLRGRDYAGKPFSFGEAAFRAATPIIVQRAINLKDDNSANAVAGVILDGLGINASTYAPKPAKETKPKLPEKPKTPKVGPISQSDIDSIPPHIQVRYQGIKSKSGEKVSMTGSARQVLKDLYAESDLYTKILESLV